MITEKQNIDDLLTRLGLVILFLLIISAFSGNTTMKAAEITQQEIFSDLQSIPINAIVYNYVQLPEYHKSRIPIIDKYNFRLPDISLSKLSYNKQSTLTYLYLQKLLFQIKPKLISKFNYYLFPPHDNSGEIPVLS